MEGVQGSTGCTCAGLGVRILAPLDDTSQARRVLAYVTGLVAWTHGKLRLVRATDFEDETSFNSLEQTATRLRDAGVNVEWNVLGGVDAETAIHTVELEWQPDLIALASMKSSGVDRWLNGSVTERVIKRATVPVLVVPPAWERSISDRGFVRILVPLDGSPAAEQAVSTTIRLTSAIPTQVILMRAIRGGASEGAQEYLTHVLAKLQSAPRDGQFTTRIIVDSPVSGILDAARDQDVDAIAMSTRGYSAPRPVRSGRVASEVFAHATVPLILLGPRALVSRRAARIKLGARVNSAEAQRIGEVHRVVVDLHQQAIVSIVVLAGGGLERDVLVPVDFIQSIDGDEVQLALTRVALADLPDFAYNELPGPPVSWTSSVPSVAGPDAVEHKRLGQTQHEVTHGTRVIAVGGPFGHADGVEWDPTTGQLLAFWVRVAKPFSNTRRIPAEWVQYADEQGDIHLARTRADIDAYLGVQ